MKLVVATGNAHKLEEFRRILSPLGVEVLSPFEAGLSPAILDAVEENGETFAENARIKSMALFEKAGCPVVADDSGLCVDALDGRPGVHSARYMGEDTPHAEKIRGLLRELAEVPDQRRTARFRAAICCVVDPDTVLEYEGVCEGSIARAPAGEGGFGYDPVFLVGSESAGERSSFAELSPAEKDAASHRGKALRALAAGLEEYLLSGSGSGEADGTNTKETL